MTEGPQPREAVRQMAPYHPPTGGRAGKLRLDFNENTIGCSPKVIEAIQQYLTADHLTVYPEYVDAMSELAAFFKVGQDEFAMTNGTDEAIQVLVNTYIDDGDDVLLMRPSYAMYRFYTEVAGGSVRELEYRKDDLSFPTDKFLEALRPETKLVMLANPNNPTGTGIKLEDIRLILETAPDAAVLIDEAYFEFCGITALPWIRKYPNLFVSRTLGHGATRAMGLEYAWQSRLFLNGYAGSAIEAYGEIENLAHSGHYRQQSHVAGPALVGGIDLHPGKLKYEVGYMFGLTPAAPYGGARWKLELEFHF